VDDPQNVCNECVWAGIGDEAGQECFDVVEQLGAVGVVQGVELADLVGAVNFGHEAARFRYGFCA
jgi:hypothetical protein